MGAKKVPVINPSSDKPQLEIADPIDDLKALFTQKTDALDKTLKTSVSNQNKITLYVIIVMGIGFIILLFSLASVLVVAWQSNQTVHDAVQLQLNNSK